MKARALPWTRKGSVDPLTPLLKKSMECRGMAFGPCPVQQIDYWQPTRGGRARSASRRTVESHLIVASDLGSSWPGAD